MVLKDPPEEISRETESGKLCVWREGEKKTKVKPRELVVVFLKLFYGGDLSNYQGRVSLESLLLLLTNKKKESKERKKAKKEQIFFSVDEKIVGFSRKMQVCAFF